MNGPVAPPHLELAHKLADTAGTILRRYFRQTLAIDDKADLTPVTIADREAEGAMRVLIESAFPAHGIIGEEQGALREHADYVWLLDPIDGTKSFISGVPLFGTLIALTYRGSPVLGLIDQPILRERWIGIEGEGTRLNDRPIACRPCGTLAQATLFCTSPDMFGVEEAKGFQRLKAAVKLTRFGADCYAYALLATGFVDLVVEANLKPYDWSALAPVISGAGGSITDWRGAALTLSSDGRVIACGDRTLSVPARKLLNA
ncbi:MAG TPA: histidinol-phosphatase [Stellaceae bacterium]|nr:histidinol-phosphatase [Stellaceae bacterium]